MGSPGRKPEVEDDEILEAIALHPDPVVTASEVAESIDMSQQGINKRLRDLADRDLIVRKEVGARAIIYWLDDDGKELISSV
jgi:DNA-binding MarR family transcriptional regulator